ncbi:hypothetical protein KIW84_042473 [Lathyrus oleraceus]|uniref:Transposon protein n=1 Tax=Pisum sativum TaxID=3888 RepID=A0A9D5ATF2_PEA|nr:hypothetical protein KIW84_042473 [Pisum sativum]
MDSDNSDNYDQEFWELVEEEFMDDSDEEEQLQNERRSGSSSRPKRRTMVDRGREEGHNRLFNDYFSENPVYTDVQFRRRFRMHRHVFLRIVDALGNHDEYFQMRVDATGKMGLSPLQKCTSAIRMLAYGSPADLVDEYVRIGESTSIECLERFVKGVNVVFGAELEFIITMETMSNWALHVENDGVGCRSMVDIKDFDEGSQFLTTSKGS